MLIFVLEPTAVSALAASSLRSASGALRAQSRLFDEGRHIPVGLIGVSNRP
jgi:hypothetical protein